jgi:hypothetical protein
MPTISACPNCDKKLKTPDGAEGRKLRCPGCQAALIITEDGLAPAEEVTAKPRKGRPSPRDEDEEDEAPRRSRRRDDEDDDEDEAPRRRSRKKAGPLGLPMWAWLTGGGVLAVGLIVLVLVLVLGGGNKFDKIKEGMSEDEVVKLMGKPDQSGGLGNNKVLAWKSGKKIIQVVLKDGKVATKNKLDLGELEKGLKGGF